MRTAQFKPGDKVEVIEDGVLINGQQVKVGDVFTVLEVDTATGFLTLNEVTGGSMLELLWRACGHSGTYRPLIDPERFKLHEGSKASGSI